MLKDITILFQLFYYFIVGVIATVIEWGLFYLTNEILEWHYAFATPFAFAFSTLANWGAGRLLLFRKGSQKGLLHELISIYFVSISGLAANLLIMWILIDLFSVDTFLSKMIATAVVFLGNFSVRKFWIYKSL